VEDRICRCTTPLTRQNLAFLQSLSLGSVINVSGDDDIARFLGNVTVQSRPLSATLSSGNTIHFLEEWVKGTLELVFSTVASQEGQILLVGNPGDCLDCLVIACMRRLQGWSLVSILTEFRIIQGPLQKKSLVAEQFIEMFDTNTVDLTHEPEFIAIHRCLTIEEDSLLRRLQPHVAGVTTKEDELRFTVLFSPPSLLLTAQSTFSEASIVNDKDDDEDNNNDNDANLA
jgi:hypothetical protein